MSHHIESMFAVGETPWHGLGKVLTDAPSVEEAIKLAGLDWSVKAVPLYTGQEYGTQKVDMRAIIRESDQKILGTCGKEYHVLQNEKAFSFFNPFVDAKEASLETAGSLREGQNIWILARLNRAPIEVTKNDIVEKYLLLSNRHQQGYAVKVGFTPIRVVCANTLAMAENTKRSELIRVRHGRQVESNLEAIRDIVDAANAQFEATAEQYKFLASRQIAKSDLEQYVKMTLIPRQAKNERQELRDKKMLETITKLFETGKGNNLEGTRGTYWAAYNAVTEFLSYERGSNDDQRLSNLWFGSSSDINEEALKVAVKMAGGL